jgi:hypothetical protein
MKKLLAMMALAGLVGTASAQTAMSVDYQNQTFANGSPDQQQITLGLKKSISTLLAVDGQVQFAQNEDSATASKAYKTTGRAEVGLTAQTPILGKALDGYARLGVGEKAPSGTERFGYHSEEIGVVYHTPIQGLHAKLGYRWRDSFVEGKGDKAETTRVALTYDLNKTNSIVYRYDDNRADSANGGNSKVNAIQYVHKF